MRLTLPRQSTLQSSWRKVSEINGLRPAQFLQSHTGKASPTTKHYHHHLRRFSSSSNSADTNDTSQGKYQSKFRNPITAALWESRQNQKKQRQTSLTDSDSETTGSGTLTETTAQLIHQSPPDRDTNLSSRSPHDSRTTIDYPFQSDDFLREAYRSPGGTMRFGKLLEDLDALAGNVAFRHVTGNPLLVTADVDRVAVRSLPRMDKDQRLSGQVTWVGTSSMVIRMQIQELENGSSSSRDDTSIGCLNPGDHWLEAYFTFVAVDPLTKKAMKIIPLTPETPEEKTLFEVGDIKAAKKKAARQATKHAATPTEEMLQRQTQATALLKSAFPLMKLPSLSSPSDILMSQTALQNTLIAQPQVTNLAGRIFGGFLMRRAFELSFANAYTFGGEWPQLLEVDHVSFHQPVDVGNLLRFESRVIYTQPQGGYLGPDVACHEGRPLISTEVECYKVNPEEVTATLATRFYFTYALPTKETCRRVLPGTMEEGMRMVERMAMDDEQAQIQTEAYQKLFKSTT